MPFQPTQPQLRVSILKSMLLRQVNKADINTGIFSIDQLPLVYQRFTRYDTHLTWF